MCGCVLVSLFARLGSLLCSVQLSSAQCRLGSRLGSGCIVRTRYAYLIIIVLCLLISRCRKHFQEEGPIVWHVVRAKMCWEGEAVQILRSLEFPQRHNHLVVPVRHRHELNPNLAKFVRRRDQGFVQRVPFYTTQHLAGLV